MLGVSLLIKCPLFITRQIVPPLLLFELCPNHSEDSSTLPEIDKEKYKFTMVVYNLLFIGRFVEILILQKHIYNFFVKCSMFEAHRFKNLCTKGLGTRITAGFVVLSVYMFVHSLSVPALGIVLEVSAGKGVKCEPYVYEYHTAYWILDIFRYIYDVIVRLFMVLATLAVGSIWNSKSPTETFPPSSPRREPTTRRDYLADRDDVNQSYIEKWKEYIRRGKEVERILDMFQVWFILPWLLYFVSSSLNTEYILRVWKEDASRSGRYDLSRVVYMIYSFNQLLLLSVPYLCARTMNAYHLTYIHDSRESLMKPHETASRMALVYLNRLEQKECYNFTPHLGGTSIKITVENPIYTIFLLVVFFFAAVHALM